MKDLLILVADLDTENVLQGFLPRVERVCGTQNFIFDIQRHPNRDPGCAKESAEFLRPFHQQYRKAVVVFDREGSGQEHLTRGELETKIEQSLAANGWAAENVAVIVLDPEIENWVWSNSPHVSNALQWKDQMPLYDWLRANNWLEPGQAKPPRPKEAMEKVLRSTKTPRSASIFREIAEKVSFKACSDPAFVKLLDKLTIWFTPAV